MILWRISNYPDLSGIGGLLHPGRWHSRGRPVVYLAESAAGALLEALVHIEATHPSELPRNYQLLEVEILEREADKLATTQDCQDLQEGWQNDLAITRRIGDLWLASAASLLLRVPSAVLGRTFSYLFNPLHLLAQTSRIPLRCALLVRRPASRMMNPAAPQPRCTQATLSEPRRACFNVIPTGPSR